MGVIFTGIKPYTTNQKSKIKNQKSKITITHYLLPITYYPLPIINYGDKPLHYLATNRLSFNLHPMGRGNPQ